mmetsp:Transcript_34349/g.65616  ORF Transcript_34349/g.65616 Transcript_34349/m.65616 type:complete len:216 (-) Transcript_34349:495-1142(-)
MAAQEGGSTSARCVSARAASSIRSGLCSAFSSPTSAGTNESTENVARDSSVAIDSSSHRLVSASICRPSSPSARRPCRMCLRREWAMEALGTRSSSPAPNLRNRPCRALLVIPPLVAAASCRDRDSDSSSSSSSSRLRPRWRRSIASGSAAEGPPSVSFDFAPLGLPPTTGGEAAEAEAWDWEWPARWLGWRLLGVRLRVEGEAAGARARRALTA